MVERQEVKHIQAPIALAPIERFDVPVVGEFGGTIEIHLHVAVERPNFLCFRHDLRTVIDGDRNWEAVRDTDALQRRDGRPAREENALPMMGLRRRTRIRSCSPSSRWTRFLLTSHPSCRINVCIRLYPMRGRAIVNSRMRDRNAA